MHCNDEYYLLSNIYCTKKRILIKYVAIHTKYGILAITTFDTKECIKIIVRRLGVSRSKRRPIYCTNVWFVDNKNVQ